MIKSLFKEYLDKYLAPITAKIYELLNGKPEGKQPPLLHKTMLIEDHTMRNSWDSASIARSVVSADVVSLDSSAPLKSRGSFFKATGRIPKLAIKYIKRESEVKDLQQMIALGGAESHIVSKVMEDVDLAIKGIEVAKEIMFQQALSTGLTLVRDEDMPGKGVRVDFGYLPQNTFNVAKKWSASGAKPLEDIQKVIDEAEGKGFRPGYCFLSKKTFDVLRRSNEAKELVARFNGISITAQSKLAVPSRTKLQEALVDELNVEFRIIDSVFRIQKDDGSISSVRPWDQENLVFTVSEQVGRLVWSDAVESTNPVEGVNYQKGEQGTLVSVFHTTDPFTETTLGQAHAIPVIDGVHGIFLLKSETAVSSGDETKAEGEDDELD